MPKPMISAGERQIIVATAFMSSMYYVPGTVLST